MVLAAAVAIHSGVPIMEEDSRGYKQPKARTSTKATTNTILDELAVPPERRTKGHSTRIGIALKRAGWTKEENRTAEAPEPRHWYEPPGGVEE
jgi:hypothetical protein